MIISGWMNRELRGYAYMPREVVKCRLQEGKEGYVPSQSNRRENTGVLEDNRFMSDQIMYATSSEGKRNNNHNNSNTSYEVAINKCMHMTPRANAGTRISALASLYQYLK